MLRVNKLCIDIVLSACLVILAINRYIFHGKMDGVLHHLSFCWIGWALSLWLRKNISIDIFQILL